MDDKNDITKKGRTGRALAEYQRGSLDALGDRKAENLHDENNRNPLHQKTAAHEQVSQIQFNLVLMSPELGVFVNDAKQRTREAYRHGHRQWDYSYKINNALVQLRLRGRTGYIRILSVDKFTFEFATTAMPAVTGVTTIGTTAYTSYNVCMVRASVVVNEGNMKYKATIAQQARSQNGAALSLIGRPIQVQLTSEPAFNTEGQGGLSRWVYPYTLFETYAPGHSHTGLPVRNTINRANTFTSNSGYGPMGTYYLRDTQFDIPYEDSRGVGPVRNAYIRGTTDWPRKNGVQVVVDPIYGSREFAIYIDASGNFAVFPTSAIGPLNTTDFTLQNVPDSLVQRFTPTYPSWCYIPTVEAITYWNTTPDIAKWGVDQPEIEWRMNHLGTKACAVVYERSAYNYDSTYWATNADPHTPFGSASFTANNNDLGIESVAQMIDPTTYNPQRYFYGPGVVEATITITLTGPADNQFVASVTIAEVRRATTDYAAPVFAGYAWYDLPEGSQAQTTQVLADDTNGKRVARAGDLVIVYCEYWCSIPATTSAIPAQVTVWSLRRRDGTEIKCYPGYPISAIDLTTLSIVFMPSITTYYNQTLTRRTVGSPFVPLTQVVNYGINEFCQWVTIKGVGKAFLFPQTMSAQAQANLGAQVALDGRAYINQVLALQPTLALLPMTSSHDGWSNTNYNNYRDWFANQQHFSTSEWFALIDPNIGYHGNYVQFKTTGPSLTPGGLAAQLFEYGSGNDHKVLMFCDNPRWNWHRYQQVLPTLMWKQPLSTFYTHPSGTWALFDSAWVYDRNGIPGANPNPYAPGAALANGAPVAVTGFEWAYDSLTSYDATKVEHVIFDAVHFELPAGSKTPSADTTFLALYNTAVNAGVAAGTLQAGINPMTYANIQATFVKEIANDGTQTFLDLHANLQGKDWWWGDQIFLGNPGLTTAPFSGFAGGIQSLNFVNYWRTTNYAGGNTSRIAGLSDPGDLTTWGIRFANPLVIDGV